MFAFLASGTFRRIIVYVVGIGIVALNRKLGLDLDAVEIGAIISATIAQIVQSSMKETAVAKAEMAISGASSAAESLSAGPTP